MEHGIGKVCLQSCHGVRYAAWEESETECTLLACDDVAVYRNELGVVGVEARELASRRTTTSDGTQHMCG